MNIVWFTWKDRSHPLAGGAELVAEEIAKRLVRDGHKVTFIVGGYKDGKQQEKHSNGYRIIRLGNRYSVYWKTWRYYKNNKSKLKADLIIEEVNTIPFFTKFYAKERKILLVHQLARKIWFYEMVFPLSLVGYLLEPLYLRMLSNQKVITVSESTKQDLMRHGFKAGNISIISEGIELEPVKDLKSIKKYENPTLLSVGAMRSMKRTLHQVEAFELAKAKIPNLKLKIAGSSEGKYGQKVLKRISNSPYSSDIEYLGRVSKQQKTQLMQKSHAILVTSVKEGWGLIVTEAASQGTPAIVYDVDGLRDSVLNGGAGVLVKSTTPQALAVKIEGIITANKVDYAYLRLTAWEISKSITFERGYKDFLKVIHS